MKTFNYLFLVIKVTCPPCNNFLITEQGVRHRTCLNFYNYEKDYLVTNFSFRLLFSLGV